MNDIKLLPQWAESIAYHVLINGEREAYDVVIIGTGIKLPEIYKRLMLTNIPKNLMAIAIAFEKENDALVKSSLALKTFNYKMTPQHKYPDIVIKEKSRFSRHKHFKTNKFF